VNAMRRAGLVGYGRFEVMSAVVIVVWMLSMVLGCVEVGSRIWLWSWIAVGRKSCRELGRRSASRLSFSGLGEVAGTASDAEPKTAFHR
jgi:hypothetical protein